MHTGLGRETPRIKVFGESLSTENSHMQSQTNGHTGRRSRVVSRSAAAPTPGTPDRLSINATVTLPRAASRRQIKDPLKELQPLMSYKAERILWVLHFKMCG